MTKLLATLVLVSCAAAGFAEEAKAPSTAADPPAAKSEGGFDISALDKSVDPCVDFYQFACGGWRKANPIPPDQSRWGRFNELAERNRNVLHDILEQVKDPRPGRSPLEAQVGDYYAACMDESAIEKRGTKPIAPILEKRRCHDVEGRPVPEARRARRLRAPRALQLRRRARPARLQADRRQPGPGRPRAPRSRRLPEGRRQVEGEARAVRRARRRACCSWSAERGPGRGPTRRPCSASRRAWPGRASTASPCATPRTATTP